jgi:cobalt-zinc-cadmium efflux system membrane fusion protein
LLPYSGQVIDVMVEPGQRVRAGDPLLRIASPELVDARNTLGTASAAAATAEEALRVAQANAKRQKAIYETAGGALKDYLQAQADLVTAQSNARTAASALRAAQDRLGLFGKSPAETRALAGGADTIVNGKAATLYRSPVSGVVADRSVAPGQFVSAGGAAALMTITDPARVWLVAQLPESEANQIRLGDHVTVTTPALPGRSFTATIDNIAAGLDPTTHRLPVRATVPNPDGALKPQMFASFVIRRPLAVDGGGVLVPAAAVIHEGDTARVWILGADKLLYGRTVVTGETEGGFTRITGGLRPGDRVVTAGALFVNEAGLEQ